MSTLRQELAQQYVDLLNKQSAAHVESVRLTEVRNELAAKVNQLRSELNTVLRDNEALVVGDSVLVRHNVGCNITVYPIASDN